MFAPDPASPGNVFIAKLVTWGVPSVFGSILVLLATKVVPGVWASIQQRISIGSQKTALESAGLGSATDVMTILRDQVKEFKIQIDGLRKDLDDTDAKLEALQQLANQKQLEADTAKSNLYAKELYIQRLLAFITSNNLTPPS